MTTTTTRPPVRWELLTPADWRQLRQALKPVLQPLLDNRKGSNRG